MPGVPSSRGCEACRKQKKKCDQSRPACSRCTRLKIDCKGCGQQRLKFVDDQPVEGKSTNLVQRPRRAPLPITQKVAWAPSNTTTLVTGAFCSALSVRDVRYDLSVYGDFLQGIPRRLGNNKALDASVNALTTAFGSVRSRYKSPEALESYGQALKALRICLNDSVDVKTADTLCAVYLVMVCQGWLGQRDDCHGHGTALAYLLNVAVTQGSEAGFQYDMVIALCVPVIVESFANPKIKLDPWLPRLAETRDQIVPINCLKLSNLARLPDLIRCPAAHLLEIQLAYERIQVDLPNMWQKLCDVSQPNGPMIQIMHARFQAAYGLMLAIGAAFNTILRNFGVDNIHLAEHSAVLVDEIIALAKDASQYRPLGSSSTPIHLISAWAATNDKAKRIVIEELIDEYQSDFSITSWMEYAFYLKRRINKAPVEHSALVEDGVETLMEAAGQCSVM